MSLLRHRLRKYRKWSPIIGLVTCSLMLSSCGTMLGVCHPGPELMKKADPLPEVVETKAMSQREALERAMLDDEAYNNLMSTHNKLVDHINKYCIDN